MSVLNASDQQGGARCALGRLGQGALDFHIVSYTQPLRVPDQHVELLTLTLFAHGDPADRVVCDPTSSHQCAVRCRDMERLRHR